MIKSEGFPIRFRSPLWSGWLAGNRIGGKHVTLSNYGPLKSVEMWFGAGCLLFHRASDERIAQFIEGAKGVLVKELVK
jgi:hypothetical protein